MSTAGRREHDESRTRTNRWWHLFAAAWWNVGYVASHPQLEAELRRDGRFA